jgi:hypothetical protein
MLQACEDDVISDKKIYPTVARTIPNAAAIAEPALAFLAAHNWTRVSLIYGYNENLIKTRIIDVAVKAILKVSWRLSTHHD